jgi:hypothetical protein
MSDGVIGLRSLRILLSIGRSRPAFFSHVAASLLYLKSEQGNHILGFKDANVS